MPSEVHTVEEAIPAIGSLPDNIDATLFIPAPLLAAGTEKKRAVIHFDIPTGASDPTAPSVLITVASGRGKAGNPSTRLARQISQGARRADLPAETTGFLATINLKIAQAIGLTVPIDLLGGIDTITR